MPTLTILTLLRLLTIISPSNPNCNSKTMNHLFFFFSTKSTKTIPTLLYLQTNCIRDYYWPSACARPPDFPTSSVFCLLVGFPMWSERNCLELVIGRFQYRTISVHTLSVHFFGTSSLGTLNVNIGTITFGTYKISVQTTSVHKCQFRYKHVHVRYKNTLFLDKLKLFCMLFECRI